MAQLGSNVIDFNEAIKSKNQKEATLIKFMDKYYVVNTREANKVEALNLNTEEINFLYMCTYNFITLEVESLKDELMTSSPEDLYGAKENLERTLKMNKEFESFMNRESLEINLDFWDLKALNLAVKSNLDLYISQFGEGIKDSETYTAIEEIEAKLDEIFREKVSKVSPSLSDDLN